MRQNNKTLIHHWYVHSNRSFKFMLDFLVARFMVIIKLLITGTIERYKRITDLTGYRQLYWSTT